MPVVSWPRVAVELRVYYCSCWETRAYHSFSRLISVCFFKPYQPNWHFFMAERRSTGRRTDYRNCPSPRQQVIAPRLQTSALPKRPWHIESLPTFISQCSLPSPGFSANQISQIHFQQHLSPLLLLPMKSSLNPDCFAKYSSLITQIILKN